MREINFLRLLLSFIISTIIFVSIFLMSNWFIISQYKKNIEFQRELKEKIVSINFSNSCSDFLTNLSKELTNAGRVMEILEERIGKEDPRVLFQKKYYTEVELKHFYAVKNYTKFCNKNITTILFFYSNKKKYLRDAEIKGYILSTLKKENPGNIMIYSFDYDLDSKTIDNLKEIYNITKPNTIIINEHIKIRDFNNIRDLKPFVEKAQ